VHLIGDLKILCISFYFVCESLSLFFAHRRRVYGLGKLLFFCCCCCCCCCY